MKNKRYRQKVVAFDLYSSQLKAIYKELAFEDRLACSYSPITVAYMRSESRLMADRYSQHGKSIKGAYR